MSRRLSLALLLLLVPQVVRAQETPERLLPAGTQVYLRWDGIEPHRAAFDKTALGKMMQEDTGKFLAGLVTEMQQGFGALMTLPQLQEGVPPEKLKKMQTDIVEAPKLLQTMKQHGLVIGIEMRGVNPPEAQLTLILPGAGAQPAPFEAAVRLLTTLAKLEVKESKVAGLSVGHAETGPVHLVWWIDGKDAVLAVGTDPAEKVVQRARERTNRLADHTEFRKLQAFKEFTTSMRGFVDGQAVLKLVRGHSKQAATIVDDLGLDGLKAIRMYAGYDGPADRSLVELDVPAPRRGLLRVADRKPFQLSDLPPIAPDVAGFTAMRFDLGNFYDVGLKAVEAVVAVVAPQKLPAIDAGLKQVDQVLGVNLRNDLLGQFGDLVVSYNSPAEGPFTLGQVVLVRVKDAQKLQQTIDQVLKSVAQLTNTDIQVKKRDYRGVALHEVHVHSRGFFFLPTYAMHDGWLAISFFPQPVQGFVLRAKKELPAWQPSADLKASLERMPTEFSGLTVSDPRPTIKQLLGLAPLIGRAITSFAPDVKLDVGSLPNGHEATKHLFPNVSVTTDDGNTLRIRSRSSLGMPTDLAGLDSYSLFVLLMFAARAG